MAGYLRKQPNPVSQTTLHPISRIPYFTGSIMDGKHTNFDMRRQHLDDEYRPDAAGTAKLDSAEAGSTADDPRDRYDLAFLAERGLLSNL